MAREEGDREDLLREATALVERIELSVPGEATSIVAGFRRTGALSVYFGADPVYQFNHAGALRRAFVEGDLYRANDGRLDRLTRERTGTETLLLRHTLTEDEAAAFLRAMRQRLESLCSDLQADKFQCVGQVPEDGEVMGRLQAWLSEHSGLVPIARSARAAKR